MKGFIKKFYQRFICKHDYHLIGETKEFHTYSDIFIYIGDIQHRIILRYDNEFIPVIKNIIGDFNLTNNIKS